MPLTVLVPAATLTAALICTLLLHELVPEPGTPRARDGIAFGAALLLYGLFYCAFFLQSFLSSSYLAPSDSLDFGVAAYLSPPALWSEGIWSGYPVAADPQALTWYPVLHLFRIAGIHWNRFLISAYVIASATTFLFVRRLTRSTLAGTFAGFVCGFNALMVGYVANFNQIHAFAWVALALYGLQLIREGRHRSGIGVTAVAVALMWLAGHPQIPVYATYMGALAVLGSLWLDRPRLPGVLKRLQWSGLAMLLGVALAAVLIVPMIELGGFSTRAEPSLERYGGNALQAFELLTALSPFGLGGFWMAEGYVPSLGVSGDSAYVGMAGLALALAALIMPARYRREACVWMGLATLEALLCLGPATAVGVVFYHAPGFASFQAPLRHLFLVALCLSVASGFAVAAIAREPLLRRRALVVIATVSILAVASVILLGSRWPAAAGLRAGNAAYATWAFGWPVLTGGALILVIALAVFLPHRRGGAVAFAVMLVLVQVADLTAVHYRVPGRRFRYADIRPEETVPHPKMAALGNELRRTGQRALATDGSRNAFLLPNLPRAWGIPAASGTGSLALVRYLEMLEMDTSGGVLVDSLADAQRGVDLLAVRYALVRQGSEAAMALKGGDRWQVVEDLRRDEEDPDTHYTLFRNTRALPPAWCAHTVVPVDRDGTFRAIRAGTLPDGSPFEPLRDVLTDASVNSPAYAEPTAEARVHFDGTRPGRYDVSATAACVLVISRVAYPWWRASLDGRPATLFPVDHALMGVNVPPGSHIVELHLRPTSVWIGAAISAMGLMALCALVFRRSPDPRRAI